MSKKSTTRPAKPAKRSAKPKPVSAPVATSQPDPVVETPTTEVAQDNAPSTTTAPAEPLTVQTSSGKRTVVRAVVFNHPITAVLRRLGREGWEFAAARKACDAFDARVSDVTIRIQLAAGRKADASRGEPAPLTKDQIKELEAAAN